MGTHTVCIIVCDFSPNEIKIFRHSTTLSCTLSNSLQLYIAHIFKHCKYVCEVNSLLRGQHIPGVNTLVTFYRYHIHDFTVVLHLILQVSLVYLLYVFGSVYHSHLIIIYISQ